MSGLVHIIVFWLLACSPSLLWWLIIFIILRPLFRIKQIGLGTVLRSFFRGLIWIFQINWRGYHRLIQNSWINWRSCRRSIQIYFLKSTIFGLSFRVTRMPHILLHFEAFYSIVSEHDHWFLTELIVRSFCWWWCPKWKWHTWRLQRSRDAANFCNIFLSHYSQL